MRARLSLVMFGLVHALALSNTAQAQSRPTVFLHGFAAQASDWATTAERLRLRVAITPNLPSLPWKEKYETQAKQLHAALGSLPANAVAVGHSNGGIVAREWIRLRPSMGGVVTIGTPHRGAPILVHLPAWAAFSGTTNYLVGRVFGAFSRSTEWTWVLAIVESALRVTADFSLWSLANLVSVLGVSSVTPVSTQMVPGSSYLSALNASSNLAQEASRAPRRVGIVSVASNFYYAGPARAIVPQHADRIATLTYSISSTLLFWGNYILLNASPADTRAIDIGLALIAVADQMLAVDPTYCLMVSTRDLSACIENDGLVPVTSQAFPGAPNIFIEGPAHIQQKQRGEDALYAALVNYVRLTPGTGTPLPPPPPPPSDEPDDPEDEDPIYEGTPIGGSPDDHDPVIFEGRLEEGDKLRAGDAVDSDDGQLHLLYQHDGNLVLYHGPRSNPSSWEPLWATHTQDTSPGVVILQHDGNLVVYDAAGRALWATSTYRTPCTLLVQSDGNVVIYDGSGSPVWATHTFVN